MNHVAPLPAGFPAIQRHAAIGDRRTGALVAADGTLNWWCVPEFDGLPMFGALLDPGEGGSCRLGPSASPFGEQSYLPHTTAVTTRWQLPDGSGELEMADLMAWPDDERPAGTHDQHVILRRLRATGGSSHVQFVLHPRWNFAPCPSARPVDGHGAEWRFAAGTLGLWASFPVRLGAEGASTEITVTRDEEHWVVIGWNSPAINWSAWRAAEVFAHALSYWRDWSAGLELGCVGECVDAARRSALTVQLLSHAEHGGAVAALTTSLPERIGGRRNYDYRFAWVRDGSLALAFLGRLGKADEVQCYLDWLAGLKSGTESPLQVVYGVDGRTKIDESIIEGVRGYRDSLPVRVGNRASGQRQLGSLAFFADCVRLYLEHGGRLKPQHWNLVCRAAEYTCRHWREPDSGIWELAEEAHYVSGRVGGWVVLERAGRIAEHTGLGEARQLARWREEADAIHAEVMDRGWNEEKGAFRQRYDHGALDAAGLLIPLMNFLPADHPRVLGTLAAVERELVVNGLLHRFDPAATLGGDQPPLGKFEGAFLPCVFWHAHLLALLGRVDEARALLSRCERAAGAPGLFAEEMDSSDDSFLGNTPLLFSHVEYIRAAIALKEAASKIMPPTPSPPL